jgi:hypothetical protein
VPVAAKTAKRRIVEYPFSLLAKCGASAFGISEIAVSDRPEKVVDLCRSFFEA